MTSSGHDRKLAELGLDPNEASGLVRIADQALLDRYGWGKGFWSVLDEVDVSECVVLLGQDAGAPLDEGWSSRRLEIQRQGHDGDVEDAEAVASSDGWVYVFGSHHGHKGGPIRREVQWVARFEEAAAARAGGSEPRAPLTVVDTGLRLHRLLNDCLRDAGIDLVPMTDGMSEAFITATRDELRGSPEEDLVRPGDWTVNIEGADFAANGDLLLGLRFPVAADGAPLVVQLSGWDAMFEQPLRLPAVEGVWVLDAIGRNGTMAGVRDLCTVGDTVHVVTGDLDSAGKGSVIREEYEGGTNTVSTHFEATLSGRGGGRINAEFVREFPDNPRIEGIAVDTEGRFFYVSDEDEVVALRGTPLLTGDG